MRSEYIFKEELQHVLAALSPENRLACEISLTTGLRLGDVLNLRADQIKERVTVRELKTGKNRAVRFPPELLDRMAKLSGKVYVFEHRYDHRRHRTRQAVFKDLKRAAALFKVPEGVGGGAVPPYRGFEEGAEAVEPQQRGGDPAVRIGRRADREAC